MRVPSPPQNGASSSCKLPGVDYFHVGYGYNHLASPRAHVSHLLDDLTFQIPRQISRKSGRTSSIAVPG